MTRSRIRLLAIYLTGFAHVFLIAFGLALVGLWLLQAGAMAFGEHFDWKAILAQLFLTISFVLFYPGQTLLSYHITDRAGRRYLIVGQDEEGRTRQRR